jgi:EmrB/QacA subfamily drug resistance transporter
LNGYLLGRRATRVAICGVLLVSVLAALNQSLISTLLPSIAADFGSTDGYSWAISAYLLAMTVTTPIIGRLSDIHGRRRFLVAGIVLLMAGSILAALAPDMTWLTVARAVQGGGAGGLVPLAIATIADLVPASDRGRWQGLAGAATGGGAVAGPAAGGWLADVADWRFAFLVPLPLAVVALMAVLVTLRVPPHPQRDTQVDYLGAAILAAGTSGLMVGVLETDLYLTAVGLLALAGFVAWERRRSQPIVPLELFRDRVYTAATLVNFGVGAGLFTATTFVPLLAQRVIGVSATTSGLLLVPLMLGQFASTAVSGLWIARTGRYRWALLSGPLLVALALAYLATLGAGTRAGAIALGTAVAGLGIGLLFHNVVLVAQNAAPSRHVGVATSVGQAFRTIGAALGISAMAAILGSSPELDTALERVFLTGAAVMIVTFALALLIAQRPLRRDVRGDAGAEELAAA